MTALIDGFRKHWEFVHTMTLDFAREVPDASWEFSPHPRFAPFCKQLRHVVCVRGVYNDALATGRDDWSRKHDQYSGGLDRDPLIAALTAKHTELLALLDSIEADRAVEMFGRTIPFAEFAHLMTQHESIHQGQWSVYASLAGFETPLRWRLEWAL
jgi:uncharacterized damage-inducible protein DinB